ncbi:MAG TPA: SgcJ/EcaC family oxidoreductase [Chloroflexota bacterium]|nr:SgcJ/EcaC family oxidoreductase [Chloroflexota bacterium]
MALHRLEDYHPTFVNAFNAGDAAALLALYDPDASLVPQPGQVVAGTEAIRAALDGFLALKGRMTLETRAIVVAGDLAQTHGQWTLSGTAPDGSPLQIAGRSAEVLRRQPDGTWLCVIDNPFADA